MGGANTNFCITSKVYFSCLAEPSRSFFIHFGLIPMYKSPNNGNRLRVSEKLDWPILSNTVETQKWVFPVKANFG